MSQFQGPPKKLIIMSVIGFDPLVSSKRHLSDQKGDCGELATQRVKQRVPFPIGHATSPCSDGHATRTGTSRLGLHK